MSDEDTVPPEEAPVDNVEGEEGEGADAVPAVGITDEILRGGMSLLCKTGEGLGHAYTRLDCSNHEITDLSRLQAFSHLRYVDMSSNQVSDLSPLNPVSHLLTLNAERNKLQTVSLEKKAFLQVMNVSHNEISSMSGLSFPMLEALNLSYNGMEKADFDEDSFPALLNLEMRSNKLTSTANCGSPNLETLFLAQNQITTISDLEGCSRLNTLHLRENNLEKLDGFGPDMAALATVNLRLNNVSLISEVEKLKCLSSLTNLTLAENPISEMDDYRIEVLMVLPQLQKLDKEEYTEEEKREARAIAAERAEAAAAAEAATAADGADSNEGGSADAE